MAFPAFHPVVRDWFHSDIGEPTTAQLDGWAAIAAGRHTLIAAPTGSGKTLRADVAHCLGSATRPMSDRDLEDKFRGLCKGVVEPQRADQLIEACWRLDQLTDVGEIARLAT